MLATSRARGYRSASRTVSAGSANTAAAAKPATVTSGAPPANAPAIRMSASADEDAIAEIPSAQPVSAGSRPRRRNCW